MSQPAASPVPPPEQAGRGSEATRTTTALPRQHGTPLRGIDTLPSSFSTEGRFGRLFRNAPVYEHDPASLAALAAQMIADPDPGDTAPVPDQPEPDEDENPNIPAGYTYLGQFIDHDITFDPVSSLQRQNDPNGLHDFRTPRFDLDSLYGRGPADQPYLYHGGREADPHPELGFDRRGVTFLLGELLSDDPAIAGPDLPRNSPRDLQGRALIGDPRNDENLLVSQLHVLFLRFHNSMVEHVFRETKLEGDNLFKRAQQQVRWHYQWIVVNDFLRRIVDGDPGDLSTANSGTVDDILRREDCRTGNGGASLLRPKFLFYHWHDRPYMPVEFSVAAYRFGHSMVRPSYFINDFVRQQRGQARIPIFSSDIDPLANLNGFRPLPASWGVQWKYFFDIDASLPAQRSYRLDTKLSSPLGALPGVADDSSLAHRNLLRSLRLAVPSGHDVARAMGLEPLPEDKLQLQSVAPDFADDAPLWYYVLREAETVGSSTRLGPVGGRIVAEVLLGLLAGDPLSYVNVAPNWRPEPPLAGPDGLFGMKELIRFTLGPSTVPPAPAPTPYPTS